MATYPAQRVHLRQPHPRVWLVIAVAFVAALIGVCSWLLVDRYSGGSSGMTNGQAVTFIHTGKGLPGLNTVNGNPNLHGSALPAKEQPYTLGMYRSGPYQERALNLFYAVGAASTHFASTPEAQALLSVGASNLTARTEASVKDPTIVTRYGVTVHQAAVALVTGMFYGAGR